VTPFSLLGMGEVAAALACLVVRLACYVGVRNCSSSTAVRIAPITNTLALR